MNILVRIKRSIEIKASHEKVWEMLAFDKAKEWMEGWKSAEYTSEVDTPEDKYRVGAIAQITEKRGKPYDFKITESLENEKIMFGRSSVPLSFRYTITHAMTMTITLKPTESGTEMTMVGDYMWGVPWGILGYILEKLFARYGAKQIERSLEKFKSVLEK